MEVLSEAGGDAYLIGASFAKRSRLG